MFTAKFAATAALVALGTAAAGSANAGNVQWSVSVNLPPVGTVVSNVPVYEPEPVYYPAPAPVVVYRPAPPPVVYRPVPVYAPPPVVYRPVPVYAPVPVVRGGWAVPPRHWDRHWDRHHHHHDRDHDGHDDRGERRHRH
jgi:hypothetical protein